MIGLILIASAAATCDWSDPGTNPFTGDVVQAVEAYNFPKEVQTELQTKLFTRQYDDLVEITKKGIKGKYQYTNLRDMHFGGGVCWGLVNKSNWDTFRVERGFVYCSQQYCILVPFICRNVSMVTKLNNVVGKQVEHSPIPKANVGLATLPNLSFYSKAITDPLSLAPPHNFFVRSGSSAPYASINPPEILPFQLRYYPALPLVVVVSEPNTLLLISLGIFLLGVIKLKNSINKRTLV